VREAGGAGRRRDGRHDRALRGPRRRVDGGVHVPLPPPVGGGQAAARRGRGRRAPTVRSVFTFTVRDPRTSAAGPSTAAARSTTSAPTA
jgi:hypothetical protein